MVVVIGSAFRVFISISIGVGVGVGVGVGASTLCVAPLSCRHGGAEQGRAY